MMHSNVLFLPFIFKCTNNAEYKKIQKPFTTHGESTKIFDIIKEACGFSAIDKDAVICPVMQLYNPVDFHSRDIDLAIECICEDAYKEVKKIESFLPLSKPQTIPLYTSHEGGLWAYKEMQPKFKPLSEISNIGDMIEDGDIPEDSAAWLYLMLPIAILHNSRKKLDKTVDFILEYFESTDTISIDKQINEHYGLTGSKLSVMPICDADFIVEEFDLIKDSLSGAMKENGYIKTPVMKDDKIGRNELCPCGSGLKYKKCCIARLN